MSGAEMTLPPMPALDDAEGARVPDGLPPVVDAHVHAFPERLAAAVRRWFDEHAWPIRYRLEAAATLRYLLDRGVSRVVVLHYAHKPGLARAMNRFVAELCAAEPRAIGLATVLPGEPGAADVLEEAFALGLSGVKLHAHVQCIAADDARLGEVYELCAARGRPVLFHAGRAPHLGGYHCDIAAICGAERIARVLADHPRLRLCVPHLGADELDAFAELMQRHEGLWLDTTMVLADYLPGPAPWWLVERFPERIMYGTDFPNIPFAWDRELRAIAAHGFKDAALERILGKNALELYGP
jgi:uncharacterized protein